MGRLDWTQVCRPGDSVEQMFVVVMSEWMVRRNQDKQMEGEVSTQR